MQRTDPTVRKLRQSTVRKSVYSIAQDGLQVKTYGSSRRQDTDSVSQNMYFQGRAIDQLRDALIEIYEAREDINKEDQHKTQLLKSFSNVDSSDNN